MATIPDVDSLNIRTPTEVGRPVRARLPQASLEPVQQTAMKKALAERQETLNREEISKAEIQFQVEALAADEAASLDPDIDTIDGRYEKNINDALGRAADNITDARVRAAFMQANEPKAIEAAFKQRAKTREKKNERERGYMANAIDVIVKGAQDLEYGDPETAALGLRDMLDSMVERGVETRTNAEATFRQAQLDMAYGRLKAMEPQQQLAVLNDPDNKWLENIPPDTLRALKEEAAKQGIEDTALREAFTMSDMDEEAGLDEIRRKFMDGEYEDMPGGGADYYEKVRVRFMREKQDQEVKLQRVQEDYYEEGARAIYFGETTLKQLQSSKEGRAMLATMTEAQRRNLEVAQDNAVKRQAGEGRKYSDRAVKDELKRMIADGQEIAARKYWSENYASLNDEDFEYYDRRLSPSKSSAAEFKPLQTTRQVMDEYLDQHPLNDQKEAQLWRDLRTMANEYWANNNGQNPPKDLINQWVKDMHSDVVLEKDGDKFLGIVIGDKTSLVRDLPKVERDKYFDVINVYRDAGYATELGTTHYNAWSEAERAKFREIRAAHPDEDPKTFLKKWDWKLKQMRQEAADKEPEKPRGRYLRGRWVEY